MDEGSVNEPNLFFNYLRHSMSLTRSAEKLDKVLFTNARIIDPEKLSDSRGQALVEDGILREIGRFDAAGFDGREVDLAGKVLCPGLIDMHVHLREPGREDKETIVTGTDAAMAGGFTGVCCMPNTEPAMDNAEVVRFVKEKARDLLVDVYPIAAVTVDRKGEELTEMSDLVEAGAVAFSDDGDPVSTAEILRHAFEYTRIFDVPIIEHCEDRSLTQQGCVNEGSISSRLGLNGMPGIAEDIIVSRDIHVARYTGGRLHIAHISTAESVELVRNAKKQGIAITCEVMTHHFTLTDEAVLSYDTNAKMAPPLRSQRDVEAMVDGLKDGTIDVIATDHAPHTIDDKQVEFDAAAFGIVGLETALGLVLTRLVKKKHLSLPQAIAKMTIEPATILRLDRGRLKKGKPASLSILDVDTEWRVDAGQFKSKSRNTPFNGWSLNGKVFGLFNNGLWWHV
jgi:dihydroorotase